MALTNSEKQQRHRVRQAEALAQLKREKLQLEWWLHGLLAAWFFGQGHRYGSLAKRIQSAESEISSVEQEIQALAS